MIGKILGSRYEVTGQIGEGGMAVVYKAFDRKLNRYVAVKILRKEYLDNQEFLNRFKVESQAAASLSHPNIVSIYDVGFEDNIHYIVMEYVKGKTLKQITDEIGPMSERDVLDISSQICAGIEHAHKNHIIHRDIKPHNIIITNEGAAKITDFGIARDVNSSTLTASGNIIGSVHYFSPEQAKGGHVDEKSDIYSLGVVMYEMATGKLPFDDESAIGIALKHVNENFKRPREINPGISFALDKIITKSMEKNAFDRYMNATLMLGDILEAKSEIAGKYTAAPKNNIQDTQVISSHDINKVFARNVEDPMERNSKGSKDMANKEVNDGMAKVSNKKGKMDKTTKIAIVTATVLILLITVAVALMIKNFFSVKPETKVPLVKGYTKKTAIKILGKKNLKWRIKDTINDEGKEKGIVISQDPKEGSVVKEDFTIGLVINEGVKKYKVPDLVGKDVDEAKTVLKNKGFHVQVVREENEADKGQVVDQEPLAGTRAEKGDKVKLTVSNGKGDKTVVVPDLVGQDLSTAKKTIKENKLTLDDFTPENSDKPERTVLRQTISANTQVPEGTGISLVVSTGVAPKPKQVTVPSLMGFNKEKALKIAQDSGLTVGNIESEESDQPKDTVINQSLTANSQVDEKSSIVITVSSGPKEKKMVTKQLSIDLPTDTEAQTVDVSVIEKETGSEVFNQTEDVSKGTIQVPVTGEANTSRTYEISIDDQKSTEETVIFSEE